VSLLVLSRTTRCLSSITHVAAVNRYNRRRFVCRVIDIGIPRYRWVWWSSARSRVWSSWQVTASIDPIYHQHQPQLLQLGWSVCVVFDATHGSRPMAPNCPLPIIRGISTSDFSAELVGPLAMRSTWLTFPCRIRKSTIDGGLYSPKAFGAIVHPTLKSSLYSWPTFSPYLHNRVCSG